MKQLQDDYKLLKNKQLKLIEMLTNSSDISTIKLIRNELRKNVEKMLDLINEDISTDSDI
jgi:hypothetical protein